MIPVVVTWTGIVGFGLGVFAALVPVRRLGFSRRRRGVLLALAGVALFVAGAIAPAAERRAEPAVSRLDEVVPRWQFSERHEIRVRATTTAVARAATAVTAREIRGFRLLTWLRNPRLPGAGQPESLLAPPADEPILDVALRSGFVRLAEEPGREVVFGTVVIAPAEVLRGAGADVDRMRAELTAEQVRAVLELPGYAVGVMNFRWTDAGGGWTRITTETRVLATNVAARRRFGVYWRIIYPGSALIRRAWLAAIRDRAEAAEAGAASGEELLLDLPIHRASLPPRPTPSAPYAG
jgi:hypothetical protein